LPIKREHAPEMFRLLGDPSLYQFTSDAPPADVAALESRYQTWERRTSPDGSELWLNWVVKLHANGRFIGHVQASVSASRATVAWVVGSQWQKQGYATEAAAAMLDWLTEFGVTEIRAAINPLNHASVRVAERLGLQSTDELSGAELVWQRDFRS
jgi:RimJ/RimL family protein N-acetyltransferase